MRCSALRFLPYGKFENAARHRGGDLPENVGGRLGTGCT
jgi:hypothetical protein